MRKLLCWFLGHDPMPTRTRQRICERCGTRETLRNYGRVVGWEEVTEARAGPASPSA